MKNLFYIVLLSVVLFSCTKDANIDIPNTKAELVVAGFIGNNEDTTRLKLTWSSPVFYSSSNIGLSPEPNATVLLSSGGNTYTMAYDTNGSFYTLNNSHFSTGDKVHLSISYNSEHISAEAIVPSDPVFVMNYLGKKSVVSDYGKQLIFNYKFTNKNTDPNNYYRFIFVGYFSNPNYVYFDKLYISEGSYFSFAYNESQQLTINSYNHEGEKLDSIRYYVIRCNKDYYKYHKSLLDYRGDDFFTEPSLVYNNVKGGLGVFAAFSMAVDTTIIR